MKLLAIDSSAKSASVAVLDGDALISECFVNASLTHSRTLMPMVLNALSQADMKIEDIEAFAVSSGPGSFTGVRIGVAAVKGLAFGKDLPCAEVSTLEAMAYNFTDEDCTVCAVMDARRSQVYNALFKIENGIVKRVTEDRAVSIDSLLPELEKTDGKIYLCGDGALLCHPFLKSAGNVILPAENRRYQRAYGVGLAAVFNNEFISSFAVEPSYLRPSQAERELSLKGE